MLHRVRMLVTKKGFNGLQPFCYLKGQVYILPPFLAKEYLARGWAMEDKSLDVPETKQKKKRKKKVV